MDLIVSLCAALEQVDGDRVIFREGEPPHVLKGRERHDIARAALTHAAIQALAEKILSPAGQRLVAEGGIATELIEDTSFPLTVTAERVDGALVVVLHRRDRDEALVEEPFDTPIDFTAPTPSVPSAAGDTTLADVIDETPRAAVEPPHTIPDAPRAIVEAPRPVSDTPRHEPPAASRAAAQSDVSEWIARAAKHGATALYVRAGQPLAARIADRIESLGGAAIEQHELDRAMAAFRSEPDAWQAGPDGEWIQAHARSGQVVCQLFTDHLGTGLVVRLRPQQTSLQLHRQIPRFVRGVSDGDGLILVSSNTESETIEIGAAVADWCGRRRGGYVIALRPTGTPAYDISGAFVSQREFGDSDAEAAAMIRRATFEGPDVLLVSAPPSELSVRQAVSAASGNRLVVLGAVAPNTAQALRKITLQQDIEADAEHRALVVQTFRAGFTLRTLRRLGGGRTYIHDLVTPNPEVGALVSMGDFAGITRVQRSGADGMMTLDRGLARAVTRGHLSLRQAAAQASDRRHLVALVRDMRRAARGGNAVAGRMTSPAGATHAGAEAALDGDDLFAAVGESAASLTRGAGNLR